VVLKYLNIHLCVLLVLEKKRRVERPPLDELIKEVEEFGYCATGRKYGVSDNAIRKWMKMK
jgi:transposase-like protein